MFYSHDVLTSRKYGVATVWLVATLGSKSSLRKFTRKTILDVDVRRACDTVRTPDAPLALRLQSNLLYGIARVYAQQCGYVLADVEAARNGMRAMLKGLQQTTLEPEGVSHSRAGLLVLQDDPGFLPDLLPDLDLVVSMGGDEVGGEDTQLSSFEPRGGSLSQRSVGSQMSIGGLDMPPSDSSFAGAGGLHVFGAFAGKGAGVGRGTGGLLLENDDLDLGLDLGPAGDLLFDDPPVRQSSAAPRATDGAPDGGARASLEHQLASVDDGRSSALPNLFDQPDDGGHTQADAQQHETTSETAVAPLRRRTTRKVIQMDSDTALSNSTLSKWSKDYLDNMQQQSNHKQQHKLNAIAKQNAREWMLGTGHLRGCEMRDPLAMFSGAAIIEAFTGFNILTGTKRPRADAEDLDQGPVKRARHGPSDEEVARGPDQQDADVEMFDDTIEQGRDAPTPLDDRHQSSLFPWNQSAGSRHPTGDPHLTSASFGGGPQLNLLSRRGSRLTSASPLLGRGPDDPLLSDGFDNFQMPAGVEDATDLLNSAEEFELYGTAAHVDTQTAAQSQWQRAALADESENFLTFVRAAVEQGEAGGDRVAFATLLPPGSNSNVVAAQALLHVLTLATRGLLVVRQDEGVDEDIHLRVA